MREMNMAIKKARQLIALGAIATALLAVGPAGAQASCPAPQITQAFAAYGDTDPYSLVPGGGFEPGTSAWALTGGAQVVKVSGKSFADGSSLALAKGASALSPPVCVSDQQPTLRLLARQTNASMGGRLKVEALYTERGRSDSVTLADLSNSGTFAGWSPTGALSLSLKLPQGFISAGGGNVQLRVSSGGGAWLLDEVYTGYKACPETKSAPSFSAFGDADLYSLVPGGGFESGSTGWALGGGGQAVSGNENFFVGSASDKSSLQLPQRATALSPQFCVSAGHPTLRLFARQVGARTDGALRVSILYPDAGQVKLQTSGVIENRGKFAAWSPSGVLPLALVLPTRFINAGGGNVQLQVSADKGAWLLDDVYYDPRARY